MDTNLAAKYRVSKLSREQAIERLRALEAQPLLWPGEAAEAFALADKIGVPIEIQRLDFGTEGTDATWKPLARE